MGFILNLTRREIRSSWRRLLFFFVCIGIGVGSIVALRSMVSNLNRAVAGEARSILAGDVEIGSSVPFTEDELAAIQTVLAQNPPVEARDENIQTSTMSRPSDESKTGSVTLELKGIDDTFPLVGDFKMADGRRFDYSLVANRGAVVAPQLLEKLNLKIGESIRIGTIDFEIRAVIAEEPGGAGGFRLGPRVFIERAAFDAAGLNEFGSRNRRRIVFRLSENPESFISQMRTELKKSGSIAAVRSYREAQENTKQAFDRAENFLSLVGLVILVLGGIGVWNVVRVFVEQKRESIAVLKCLGASGIKITAAYLLQILSLGLLGSLFGAGLAAILLRLIEMRFAESLPLKLSYNLQTSAVVQGILLGLAISALFSLLPLLRIKNIKPRLLLRDSANEQIKRFSPLSFLAGAAFLGGLMTLAIWQANSWRIGLYFLTGLATTSAILYAAAFVLTKLLRIFRYAPSFSLRQAVGSLSRPGNQTRVVLLAVGLGVFVILAVQNLQANLLREFDFIRGNSLPSLFLIDIQPAQTAAVKNLILEQTGETIEYIPAVRARISAINGKANNDSEQQREVRQQSGQVGREYVLTYRPTLIGDEEIVAGKFWHPSASSDAEVSVDESLRGLLNLDVGSVITFDILGQKLNAKVTSIRKIDARNLRSTFLIVFRPGSLENAPQTLLCPVMTELDTEKRGALQRSLIDKFPNIFVLDTADAVASVRRLLVNFTLAVSFVGGFVFLSGALILIGSIALTKFQRIYENAILKTLGAQRKTLLAILLFEYAVLGAAAGLVGSLAASALSYVVARYVLDIKWQFDWTLTLLGLLVTVLLVTIIGAISSFDVLLRKPLGTLRSQ